MRFKDAAVEFRHLDITLIDPSPSHPRQQVEEGSLKGLVNSIEKKGLIQPILVQPADANGRYRLIVGERRRQAALLAGETTLPALIRSCPPDELLEIQVFENLGLGVRAPLEPRDMANAIQRIAERFETPVEAAEQFGRSQNWLSQATAAANLSPKVSALLDSGKITSTTTAIQIEKLAQKDEATAESLIVRIEQLPEGEKLPRDVVDAALCEAGVRRRKKEKAPAVESTAAPMVERVSVERSDPVQDVSEASSEATQFVAAPALMSEPSAAVAARVNPGKVRQVAALLGLDDQDEAAVLDRLIDEFLALKGEAG